VREEIEIQISIKLLGEGFPSEEEFEDRNHLEDVIEEQGIGDVVHAGGGMGFMDIAVEVSDPNIAMVTLESLVSEMGFSGRTTFKIVRTKI
jgi:hypothetical protein